MSAIALTAAASYAVFPQDVNPDYTGQGIERVLTNPVLNSPEREAEESVTFTYADGLSGLSSLTGSQVRDTVYLAFKFAKEDQTPYIGAKITGMHIVAGMQKTSSTTNCFSNVFAYVSEDMNQKPTGPYIGKGRMSSVRPNSTKLVELDEAYTITGEKDIYVGYYFRLLKAGTYIPCDNSVTDKETCLVYRTASEHSTLDMQNYAGQFGSLYLPVVIAGDNLPQNVVTTKDLKLNGWFPLTQNVNYKFYLKNLGANGVREIVVRTDIDGSKVDERTITFAKPVVNGESTTVKIDGLANPGDGSHEISSTLLKVNGVDVTDVAALNGSFSVSDLGFTRRVVVEEGTGTWCGWCPRGIVMMEYFKEHYPTWIRIAVHSGDEMYTNTYARMINRYFSSFPTAIANREKSVTVAGDMGSYYTGIADYFGKEDAPVRVDLEASCADGNVNIITTTEASADYSQPLQLSFVLVEDGVGPYYQTNNYSGTSDSMDGWEGKADPAETIYDDVARLLDGYPGIENSVPDQLVKGEKYKFERSISLTRNGNDVISGSEFKVVALLVNPNTGYIVNANEYPVNISESGVIGVSDEAIGNIRVENGAIVSNAPVQVYTLDGRRVSPSNLSAGVYIVSCNGTTKKILVK